MPRIRRANSSPAERADFRSSEDRRKAVVDGLLHRHGYASPEDHLGTVQPLADRIPLGQGEFEDFAAIARVKGIAAIKSINQDFSAHDARKLARLPASFAAFEQLMQG